MSCDLKGTNIDIRTPYNVKLRAFFKRSFAYYTVKERLPVIVTQTIDSLSRTKEQIIKTYGCEAAEEIKIAIGELSKFKYEIQTNKPLKYIKSKACDAKVYNDYLDYQQAVDGNPTYYNAVWLHVECYMYRRIREIFENLKYLNTYDPFKCKKDESFHNSVKLMIESGTHTLNVLKSKQLCASRNDFITLLKMNLWGNKCDLSLSLGVVHTSDQVNQLSALSDLEAFVLCDHSEEIWKVVADLTNKTQIIDIILDNAGYEFFTDLCLADFMMTRNFAKKIRFYVKQIPWFISDIMIPDLKWFLEELLSNENSVLKELGNRWSKYFDEKLWTVEEYNFWILPFDCSMMKEYDFKLYQKLGEAKLVIFKGDLNYRKLFGEMNWHPETPVVKALQGFHPTNVCILRTLKSDIICGLEPGLAEKTEAVAQDWLTSGNYGVIQFCNAIN